MGVGLGGDTISSLPLLRVFVGIQTLGFSLRSQPSLPDVRKAGGGAA